MSSTVIYRLMGLAEGLVYTEEPNKTIRLLKQWEPRIQTYGGYLQVNFAELAPQQAKDLLRDLDRLGWFPSMLFDQEGEQQRYESSTFLALAQASVGFEAKFEAKYDPVARDLPDSLWHVAPAEKRRKTEAFGLTPRANGKLSPHPDRVYLLRSETAAVALAAEMGAITRVPAYALFQVTTRRPPRWENEQGYYPYRVDPNYPEQSVYSVVNSPPSDVSFVRLIDTGVRHGA